MIRSGSTLGLLGHELRLTWRGWFGRREDGKLRGLPQLVITVIFLLFVLMAAGVPVGLLLRSREVTVDPMMAVIVGAVVAGLFTLMLSQTLLAAVRAFYTRGDLDLLLSAPISPTKVLGVRAVSMAISAAMIFAVVLAPLLIPIVALGQPRWLSAYGVLAAVSMAATGIGLVIALGLMTSIGPRRTRTVAQLLAALIGASFFILSQLQNIIGGQRAGGFWTSLFGDVLSGETVLPAVAYWPARAVMGEPGPLLGLLAAAAAVFLGAILLVGRRFAADAAAAKGAEVGPRARTPDGVGRFTSGAFAAMLAKELRLLRRDPAMLSQVLLRALYIPPLVFLLVRNSGNTADPLAAGGAAGLVFMAGQVSASLSWITLSGEEAPELLVMSPAKPWMIWRAKLTAGLVPLAIFFVVPLLVLAWLSPVTGLITAVGCAAAAVSAGWINIWLQKPGDRKDFRRRRGAGLAATLAELLVALLWGLAAYCAVTGFWLGAGVAVALALVMLAVAHRPEEAILRRLTEAAT